jgi:hypothetical protein
MIGEMGLFPIPETDDDRAELERRRVEYELAQAEERKRWREVAQREQEREAKIAEIENLLEPVLAGAIVEEIESRRLPDDKKKLYAVEWRRFKEFCGEFDLLPLPCHPLVLAAHLTRDFDRTTAELEQAVEAISAVHRLAEEADPTTDSAVAAVLRLSRIHSEHELKNGKESQ